MKRRHAMPFGAEIESDGKVRFRLWGPKAENVEIHACGDRDEYLPLQRQADGWFELITDRLHVGSSYKYRIDGRIEVPDPASRYQPQDVHGPSQVVDSSSFDWQDDHWVGLPWKEAVIYELHVGTFTPEGTFAALEQRLDYLADLGITAIELMPLSDFPGKRNWGYDGVLHFAPDSQYGRPEDLKQLIQSAHARGLMMFLDVVYNHFGPDGNFLREYAPQFFTGRHHTPWGEAINFDGSTSRKVRDFFIHNALYWLEEFHFDGLRFDAVNAIVDDSKPDILTEIAESIRSKVDPNRQIHLVLESDSNAASYLERDARKLSKLYDAQWNDDIHHAFHVAITGEQDGYYADYSDCGIDHLGRCLAEGFDYQGQPSPFRGGAARGEPSKHLPPGAFVSFLQNHDQIGNRAFGERLSQIADSQALQAAAAILLLAPSPPLLFMGEEFAAETPFLFFCDFHDELAAAVTNGRRLEFARFSRFNDPAQREQIPDPNASATFQKSKLDWNSIQQPDHQQCLNLYRELLRVRKREIVPLIDGIVPGKTTYRVWGCQGLEVRWQLENGAELTLLTNLSNGQIKDLKQPPGRLLYSNLGSISDALKKASMPAWTAAWFLRS